MGIGQRILAYAIDVVIVTAAAVCFTLALLFWAALIPEDGALSHGLTVAWIAMWGVYVIAAPALCLLFPILYFAGFTAWRGRTPGKMLCRVRVVADGHTKPGLLRVAGRESLKMVAVVTQIGAWIALVQLLVGQRTWCDSLAGTAVESYAGLTETQKNFRKYNSRY
jgi:uncharacterized RDD family membrane protein YckC